MFFQRLPLTLINCMYGMVNRLLFVLVRTVRKNRIQTKREIDELGDKI